MLVLGQKAVARVDGIRASGTGGFQNGVDLQVTVAWLGATDAHGLITSTYVLGVGVRVGVNRNGTQPQAAGSGGHPAGNFTAIGYQQGLKHSVSLSYMRNTPKRVSSIGAFKAADRPRARTRRVSEGWMMPSSHRRAVA